VSYCLYCLYSSSVLLLINGILSVLLEGVVRGGRLRGLSSLRLAALRTRGGRCSRLVHWSMIGAPVPVCVLKGREVGVRVCGNE
jgi:hypothetical protein